MDQSYWQSSVAAKPKQGVVGFLVGGLCWFAIPFGLATTTSLAYIALSANQNQALLSETDVDAGKVPYFRGKIFNWSKQNELFLLRKIAHIFVAIRFCAIPEGRQSGINFIGYFKSDMIQLNLPLAFCFLSDQAEIVDFVVRTGKFQFKWALALKHEDIGIEHLSTCIILLIVIVSRHTWNVYNLNMKKNYI